MGAEKLALNSSHIDDYYCLSGIIYSKQSTDKFIINGVQMNAG